MKKNKLTSRTLARLRYSNIFDRWWCFFKSVAWQHYVSIALIGLTIALTFLSFGDSIRRFGQTILDVGTSAVCYFGAISGIDFGIMPTIKSLAQNQEFATIVLPSFDSWSVKNELYWNMFANGYSLQLFGNALLEVLAISAKILLCVAPLILLLILAIKRYGKKQNNNYNKDTIPLKIFKFISTFTYVPIKKVFISYFDFVKSKSAYLKILAVLWLFNLNAFAITTELVAFILYFAVTFDLQALMIFIYKVILDLQLPFTVIPGIAWFLLFLFVVSKLRAKIGFMVLNSCERKDTDFVGELDVATMVVGTMGKKKTTTITDMTLTEAVRFRNIALKKMFEHDMKFPNFPWINYENEIKKAMKDGLIFSLATCKVWARANETKFWNDVSKENCFGYDFAKYGFEFNDNLQVKNIFQILETYTQLYFIYVVQSSLIIGNFSIRADYNFVDSGNLPLWQNDFFKAKACDIEENSKHAHILDFDTLRLGKKFNEKSKESFEFGVINMTEVGKERGNRFTVEGEKAKADTVNRKNDHFNEWLKLIRHSSTVDNFPFAKVLMDEQRPESLGADCRELCNIVHIEKVSKPKLAMPFFFVEELLNTFFFERFKNFYFKIRHNRGDNTLVTHIFKKITSLFFNHYTRVINQFGYCVSELNVENSSQNENNDNIGKKKNAKYFLMNKKIYAKRFSTDCFNDYFVQRALHSKNGIAELREYESVKASMEELESQNSFFITELSKIKD